MPAHARRGRRPRRARRASRRTRPRRSARRSARRGRSARPGRRRRPRGPGRAARRPGGPSAPPAWAMSASAASRSAGGRSCARRVSISPRSAVSGVRISWEASAAKRSLLGQGGAQPPLGVLEAAEHPVHRPREAADLVGAALGDAHGRGPGCRPPSRRPARVGQRAQRPAHDHERQPGGQQRGGERRDHQDERHLVERLLHVGERAAPPRRCACLPSAPVASARTSSR